MKNTSKKLMVYAVICLVCFVSVSNSQAGEVSFNHTYPAAEWNYQGNPIPETYWTPWLPIGAQQLTRFRIGFRLSSGTIAVKCPVKLTFKYDTANAQSGKDLPIKVKAELVNANYKTFESAFGLHLPNEFQVGFIGITGVPDFLPWFTLPWGLCEILGSIPGLPSAFTNKVTVVCSAIENFGVNMNTQNALPLPGEAAYHDTRTLIDLKLTDFMTEQQKTQFIQNVGIKFFNGISSKLGPVGMSNLLLVIGAFKNLDEAGATEFLTDQCISAAGKFTDILNLTTIGDPYFKVEGVELNVLLRMYIPNGKGSGTYPMTFTSSGQEQTVTFRDITPFIQAGDKLVVVADSISYKFKLRQCLKPIIKISILPEFPIDTYEKYITLATAKKDLTETEFKGEIPLVPSTNPIQGLRAQPGCTSAQVNWTSPIVPLKGTIKAYQGNTLVKTLTENTFKAAHNNIITDLNKQTTYRLEVSGVTESGATIQGGSVTVTTKKDCQPRTQQTTCNSLKFSSTPTATASQNYIDFSWTTNERASTEVLISPSPDLSANYVACVKKSDGTVNQGWVTQGGVRELVTSHSIRITDLEPGTKYYYNVVSWTFKNNNPNDNPLDRVGYVGEITTSAPPEQPSMRIKVLYQNQTVADAKVVVSKVGDAAYKASVVTASNGMTEPLMLDKGKSYIVKVLDSACYQDFTSSAMPIPSSAQGEQSPFVVNLQPKPNVGAYVYDTAGRPISGVVASFSGNTATTNASGYYSFGEIRPTSSVTITVTKVGYLNGQVEGKVTPCGRSRTFTTSNCVLKKNEGTIDVYVKKHDNTAVSGASIAVKKGSQTIATASTNSQGKASINVNFTNANEQSFVVTATPPSSLSGASAVSETMQLAPEGKQSVYLSFIIAPPPDTQGPVISNVSFKQPSKDKIEVSFKANEQVSTVSLEYKFPNGQIKNTSWYTYNSSLFLGNVSGGYTTAIGDSSLTEGQYKIRLKCKDSSGNLTETNQYDFTMFGGTLWNLKASKITADSITLSWTKFPNSADFVKYTITPESGSAAFTAVDIANINQTSHTFSGLQPGKTYKFGITAISNTAGWPLTVKGLLNVGTTALASPIISSFTLTPKTQQEANQTIKITAKITDSDSMVKKVTLTATNNQTKQEKQIASNTYNSNTISYSQSFTLDQPGTYTIILEAADESAKTYDSIEYNVLPASTAPNQQAAEQAVTINVGIKSITLEGEEKSTVPAAKGLSVNIEMQSNADVEGPITVLITLKSKTEKQEFKQQIKNLKKGLNSFKWPIVKKIQAGRYTLNVEIINEEPSFKTSKTKTFTAAE